MPRKPRLSIPGAVTPVMLRCLNGLSLCKNNRPATITNIPFQGYFVNFVNGDFAAFRISMTNDTNKIKRRLLQKNLSQEPLLLVSVVEPGIFRAAVESNLLRQSKIKNKQIELLGGNPKRNDLIAYLS